MNVEIRNNVICLFIGKMVIRQHYTGLHQIKKSLTNIAKITGRFRFEKRSDKTRVNDLVIEYCDLRFIRPVKMSLARLGVFVVNVAVIISTFAVLVEFFNRVNNLMLVIWNFFLDSSK
jgi:hypothetical protein